MKGVQIVEPNKLQIVDLEKPQIDKENNVLVRIRFKKLLRLLRKRELRLYHSDIMTIQMAQ